MVSAGRLLLLPLLLLLCAAVALLPTASGVPPPLGGRKCSSSADCRSHNKCVLLKGQRCCWPKGCHPQCRQDQECVRSVAACGEAGVSCSCPPRYKCKTISPLPLTRPPTKCSPACQGDRICFLVLGTVHYTCIRPFPGCYVWWSCSVGGYKLPYIGIEEDKAEETKE